MSLDLELESWRREWSHETEPLPDLKGRIRRQNRRIATGALAIVGCLALATAVWLEHPTTGWASFAVGVWLSVLVAGGYAMWLRRGAWTPEAETTGAYAELLHRRAVAELGKIVFIRRSLLAVLVGYGVLVIWRGHVLTLPALLVAVAVVVEMAWMRWLERRRRRAVEDAAGLVERLSDASSPED